MSSDLENLKACKKASDALFSQIDANQKLTNYYNDVTMKQYESDHLTWQNKHTDWKTSHDDWKRRYDTEKSQYANARKDGSCNAASFCPNSNCPSGYTDDGSVTGLQSNCDICVWFFGEICTKTGCHKSCKPDDQNLNKHMTDWLESNKEPSEPMNEPKIPSQPQLNLTPASVSCCANISNIVGSTVTDSQISQLNQCTQSIAKQIDEAESDKPTPTVKSPENSTPTVESPDNPTPTVKDPENSTTYVKDPDNHNISEPKGMTMKTKVMIIVAVVVCLSLSSLLSILITSD